MVTDPLRLLNQPRVIAEVLGGILLGPSVMMRIPGFKDSTYLAEWFVLMPWPLTHHSHLPH